MSAGEESFPTHAEQAPFDEGAFFRVHLQRVEFEAAQGTYGTPTYFMAGIEQEAQVLSPSHSSAFVAERSRPDVQLSIEKHGIHIPDTYKPLRRAEQQAALDLFRREAYAYISALTPTNQAEAAKQQRWLAQIPELGIVDLINFKLYQEFSKPTLGNPAPARHTPYETLKANEQSTNWLEFRFGNDILQEGWYDDTDVTEYRLLPCSPTEAVRRRDIIQQRFDELIAEYGCLRTRIRTHSHLSAFQEKDGSLRPVLGTAEDRLDTNLRAIAGITQALADGAWMWLESANNPTLFKELEHIFKITENRDSIRLLADRVELRDRALQADAAHGLLWLTGALLDGLRTDEQHHNPVPRKPAFRVKRTEAYDKDQGLTVERMLQRSELTELGFEMDASCAHEWAGGGLQYVTGVPNPEFDNKRHRQEATKIVGMAILYSLTVNDEGRPICDADKLASALQGLPDDATDYVRYPVHDPSYIEAVASGVTQRSVGLRIEPGLQVKETATMEPLPPSQRQEVQLASSAMKIAYSDNLQAYVRIMALAAKHTLATVEMQDYIDHTIAVGRAV